MSLLRLVLLASIALSSMGCAASLRERVTPFSPSTPRTVPWTLNEELLMPVNQRIQIAVELVKGHPPETAALDVLASLASRYGERPATWTVAGLDGAPPLRFDGEVLRSTGKLDEHTSYVMVRYVADALPRWGWSYSTMVDGRRIYVILINQERHRRYRAFVPERHLEAQTLVHEYGHLIGLPPFDHGYYPLYPSFAEGAHCVNPDCALSKPRFRALLYGLGHTLLGRHYLEDYCAACRAAIAAAKAKWRRPKVS